MKKSKGDVDPNASTSFCKSASSVRKTGDERGGNDLMTENNVKKVPQVTVKRLGRYLRVLERFHEDGIESISSEELAAELHVKPSQLRKDLAYFGEFGTREWIQHPYAHR